MSDNTLEVLLKLKDEMSARLKDIEGSLGGLTGATEKQTGAFQRMMEVAGGVGLVKIASDLIEAGKSAVTFSVQAAGGMEQTRIAFDTMIGNTKLAKKTLEDLSDFAMKTPFDLPQLIDGSKRLLAYNVEAKDLVPTMKMLGDITSGVGREKLPQLILAYGQVRAATKLTGAELRQFSEAGVPLLDALVQQANKAGGAWVNMGGSAKKSKVDVGELNDKLAIASQRLKEAEGNAKTKQSTLMSLRNTVQNYQQSIEKATGATAAQGKVWVETKVTAAEMIKKVQDGQITFEEVQKALEGMTKEGGKFFNLMAKQANTFEGAMSNLKDATFRFALAFMGVGIGGDIEKGGLFDQIRNSAVNLLDWVNNNSGTIKRQLEDIGNTIGAGFGIASKMVGSTVWAFGQLKNTGEPVIDAISKKVRDFNKELKFYAERFGQMTGGLRNYLAFGKADAAGVTASWDQAIQGINMRLNGFRTFLAYGVFDMNVQTSWATAMQGIYNRIAPIIQTIENRYQQMKNLLAFGNVKGGSITIAGTEQQASALQALIGVVKATGNSIKKLIDIVYALRVPIIIVATAITTFFLPSLVAMGTQAMIVSTSNLAFMAQWLVFLANNAIRSAAIGFVTMTSQLVKFGAQGWITVASLTAQTAAWVVNTTMKTINAIVTGQLTFAVVAQSVATGVLTAATWLLNIAMAVLTSPIFLVITAITIVVGLFLALTGNLGLVTTALGWVGQKVMGLISSLTGLNPQIFNTTNSTNGLKNAQEQLRKASEDLKYAQDNLKNAELDLEGAQIRVERATLNEKEMIKQYGTNSLEAREATLEHKRAQNDLETAQEAVKTKTQEVINKNTEYNTKSDEVNKKVEETTKKVNEQKNAFQSLVEWIGKAMSKFLEWVGLKDKHGSHGASMSFATGGPVPYTGMAKVHAGEYVLSRDMLAGRQAISAPVAGAMNSNNRSVNVYATINTPVDLNVLGYQLGLAVRN